MTKLPRIAAKVAPGRVSKLQCRIVNFENLNFAQVESDWFRKFDRRFTNVRLCN